MPSLKFIAKAIAALPAPDLSGRQVLYFDSELKGFGVLASGKTTAKTFIIQKDLKGGKTRRITIGAVNVLSLENARAEARDALALIYRGIVGRRSAATPISLKHVSGNLAMPRLDIVARYAR